MTLQERVNELVAKHGSLRAAGPDHATPSGGQEAGPGGSVLSDGLGQAPERENAEERFCRQALADLRRSYDAAAKPYIDRLVAIHSMRQAPSITLTLNQAREFIDFTMGPNGAHRCVEPRRHSLTDASRPPRRRLQCRVRQ